MYRRTLCDPTLLAKIWEAFDRDALARICEMDEAGFEAEFAMTRYAVDQPAPADFFYFRAAGTDGHEQSKILAVAHLDTVAGANPHARRAQFLETEGGMVVYSRALDDRLGAYIILDLLPKLGIHFDVLLTVGEETGRSTAQFFDMPGGMKGSERYNWMIEFDRGGTDVVLYQYDDAETAALVEDTGAVVEEGIFSDISYLEHLGIKGFNWGVGYQDYHGPRAHAWLDDTFEMLAFFLAFHETNKDVALPHVPESKVSDPWSGLGFRASGGSGAGGNWDDDDRLLCDCDDEFWDECEGKVTEMTSGLTLCEAHMTALGVEA